MIGWLKGIIIDKSHPGKFVLNVNGVGYEIETSLQTFFELEAQVNPIELQVHTVVREDAFLLFGFATLSERALFRALIKINGVGPKVAINILSSVSPPDFVAIIRDENLSMLVKLPGIGKKTAERLLIEMKDNIEKTVPIEVGNQPIMAGGSSFNTQQEAIFALEALGYKPQEATKLIKKIDDGQKNCEQLIRAALQLVAR